MYVRENKIQLDRYRNVFVTADLHLGHRNIIRYENRADALGIPADDVEAHDIELIELWNNTVNKDDLVFVLGDISFANAEKTNEMLKAMIGNIVLITGNHDYKLLDDSKFDTDRFITVKDYMEVNYRGQMCALMHYPILSFKNMHKPVKPWVHMFGHIHNSMMQIPANSFNAGVMLNDYRPVNMFDAIDIALKNNGGMINGYIKRGVCQHWNRPAL